MPNSIVDHLLQFTGSEPARSILRTPAAPVSMRLLLSSPGYKKVIESALQHMNGVLDESWSDVNKQRAVSAPILGIPLRIVIVIRNDNTRITMLNPVIIERSETLVHVSANCGCIRLKTDVSMKRYEWVIVRYLDQSGAIFTTDKLYRGTTGLQAQHEIEHLDGILLTDRYVEQGNSLDTIAGMLPGVPGL